MSLATPPRAVPHRGSRFRLRCWGARGTIPTPGPRTVRYGGNTACVEVRVGGDQLVILDAGTGLRGLGQSLSDEAERGAAEPAQLFLTHQHSDHVIGLPHFAPLFSGAEPLSIITGCASVDATRELLTALITPPLFPSLPDISKRLSVRGLSECAPAKVGDDCTVHSFKARHPGGAAIFRIDDAKGPGIAFAPDNELDFASTDADVIAWRHGLTLALHGVPILLHDATYTDPELPSHRGWGHSSALEATRFAMECVAGMLVLFHHHPDRSDEAVDAIVQECRQLVSGNGSSLRVIAAWEGLTLTV